MIEMKPETEIMKQLLIMAIALIAATGFAEAQETSSESRLSRSSFRVVPVLGSTSFSMTGDDANMATSGMSVGALVEQRSSVERLSYEYGLTYFEAGSKGMTFFTDTVVKLSYIGVPLNVKYQFNGPEVGKFQYHGKAGLMVAGLLAANQKTTGYFGVPSSESDVKDDAAKSDIMWKLGLDASIFLRQVLQD